MGKYKSMPEDETNPPQTFSNFSFPLKSPTSQTGVESVSTLQKGGPQTRRNKISNIQQGETNRATRQKNPQAQQQKMPQAQPRLELLKLVLKLWSVYYRMLVVSIPNADLCEYKH